MTSRTLWTLALLFVCAVFLRLDTLFVASVDWDESVYFLMADSISRGEEPYTVMWDHKPPLIFYVYMVGRALSGGSMLGVRLLACLAVAVSALMSMRIYSQLTAREGRRPWWLAAMVLVAFRLYGGTAANTEVFFAPVVAAVVWCMLRALDAGDDLRARRRQLLLAGFLTGVAFWLKFNTAIDIAIMLLTAQLVFHFGRRPRPTALQHGAAMLALGAGFVLATVLVLSPYINWDIRVLQQALVEANLRHVGQRPPLARSVEYVNGVFAEARCLWTLAGMFLVWVTWKGGRERPALFVVAAWLLSSPAAALAPGQPYPHYALETLVPLCVAGALMFDALVLRHVPEGAPRSLALTFLVITSVGLPLGLPLTVARQARHWAKGEAVDPLGRAAAWLKAEDAAGSTSVFVLDERPMLYHLLGTRPPTRYPFPPWLLDPRFVRVVGIDAQQELQRILAQEPRYILRRAEVWPELADSRSVVDAQIAPTYSLKAEVEGVEILERSAD